MNNDIYKGLATKGYKIESQLGQGSFGQVFKGLKQSNQQQVAIKIIEIDRFSENEGLFGRLVESEIQALKLVKSENVIGFVDNFSDMKYCYIVMEYCDSGDLENQLRNSKIKITEQDALGIFKQILNGLRDLHQKYIIHRDLKAANILIHNNSIYKIADLGFCKLLDAADQKSKLQLGSLFTMAPEIFNQKPYGLSSDMFSLGVIFYQILYNRLPFKQRDYLSNDQPIMNFEPNKIEVSYQTQDLLFQMLQFDPQTRISFQNIINHAAFDKPIFSQISRIILQTNRIPFDDYQEFYQNQSFEIEAQHQNSLSYNYMPQNVQVQQKPKQKITILSFKEFQQDNDNKLGLQIDKINQKINHMFFFSNTFQELVNVLQSPNLMALVCLKLQKLCHNILKIITENIEKYKNQRQYELDYNILQQQYREMISQSEIILYQFNDLQEQLQNFNQIKLLTTISKDMSEQQFNILFYQQLTDYLQRENFKVVVALSHLIFCYLYCVTENSQFLEFDQKTFDLKKSKEPHNNKDHLLNQIQLFSSRIF